jgi:hypothetical protein
MFLMFHSRPGWALLGGLGLMGCGQSTSRQPDAGPVVFEDRLVIQDTDDRSPLGIPVSALPAPGACRLWKPGRPVREQAPPGNCSQIEPAAPPESWILYRPSEDWLPESEYMMRSVGPTSGLSSGPILDGLGLRDIFGRAVPNKTRRPRHRCFSRCSPPFRRSLLPFSSALNQRRMKPVNERAFGSAPIVLAPWSTHPVATAALSADGGSAGEGGGEDGRRGSG